MRLDETIINMKVTEMRANADVTAIFTNLRHHVFGHKKLSYVGK